MKACPLSLRKDYPKITFFWILSGKIVPIIFQTD